MCHTRWDLITGLGRFLGGKKWQPPSSILCMRRNSMDRGAWAKIHWVTQELDTTGSRLKDTSHTHFVFVSWPSKCVILGARVFAHLVTGKIHAWHIVGSRQNIIEWLIEINFLYEIIYATRDLYHEPFTRFYNSSKCKPLNCRFCLYSPALKLLT